MVCKQVQQFDSRARVKTNYYSACKLEKLVWMERRC